MEILDLYSIDGNKLNKTHIRGEPLKENEYCIAVDVWIKNDKEQILLTQRHSSKIYPMKWECTSGFIKTGEDSFSGALREVQEEIGIKLEKSDGRKIHKIIRYNKNLIFDIFLFEKNIDIEKTKLQKEEVINIKWVEKTALKEMFQRDEMVEPLDYICELIDKKIV